MTDRELLETAARASGIKGKVKETADGAMWLYQEDFQDPWNPLVHDGDALRLAASMGLMVDASIPGRIQCAGGCGIALEEEYLDQSAPNRFVAMRRAIVRVTAMMGKP